MFLLLAEVYNPAAEYRNHIRLGVRWIIYMIKWPHDKLKEVKFKEKFARTLFLKFRVKLPDIEHHMFHFLDNQDEQRLVSPEFATHLKRKAINGSIGNPLAPRLP
jgi:hypothetical protein